MCVRPPQLMVEPMREDSQFSSQCSYTSDDGYDDDDDVAPAAPPAVHTD